MEPRMVDCCLSFIVGRASFSTVHATYASNHAPKHTKDILVTYCFEPGLLEFESAVRGATYRKFRRCGLLIRHCFCECARYYKLVKPLNMSSSEIYLNYVSFSCLKSLFLFKQNIKIMLFKVLHVLISESKLMHELSFLNGSFGW